jgi:hypothetical protein
MFLVSRAGRDIFPKAETETQERRGNKYSVELAGLATLSLARPDVRQIPFLGGYFPPSAALDVPR